MLNLKQFIADHVINRQISMFAADIEANKETLRREIENKSVCVVGGAGSIGSSFIRAVLPFRPAKLVVVDLNENGLAELTRDLRSTYGMYVPQEYRTYTLNFADPIFERIFREEEGFDIFANFSAHKHVRSEKDKYSVQALIENNDIKAKRLLDLLAVYPPQHFFCVSTDKAANPINIMGASKRIMEDLIMAYTAKFKVTTARFANVAFSNGSLPDGWVQRVMKKQPLAAPNDVKRYFVSLEESGQICMLACILGKNGEIFSRNWERNRCLHFLLFVMSISELLVLKRNNLLLMKMLNSSLIECLTIIKNIRSFILAVIPRVRKLTKSSMYLARNLTWIVSKALVSLKR